MLSEIESDLGYCCYCFHPKSEHGEHGCNHRMSFRYRLIGNGRCSCRGYEPTTYIGELSKNNPHYPDHK